MREQIALIVLETRNVQKGPYETADEILAALSCGTCRHLDPSRFCLALKLPNRPYDWQCATWAAK